MQRQLTRKQRERLRHKNEILDAAERVFSRRGYHAALMADVAEDAEFAVGTLYKFFKSKEDLYSALFMRKIDEMRKRVRSEAASVKHPREKIEKIIDTNLYYAQKYREFFMLHMTEVLGVLKPVPLASPEIHRRYQEFIKFLTKIIKAGQSKRIFCPLDPSYAAVCLIGVMHNCAALWMSGKNSMTIEDVADMAKNIYFNGVARAK